MTLCTSQSGEQLGAWCTLRTRGRCHQFGRLLADYAWNPINLFSVRVTSLAALVYVYRVKTEYALFELAGDGVDTVGVWGSNPHAPTISIAISFNDLPEFLLTSFLGLFRICRNFAGIQNKNALIRQNWLLQSFHRPHHCLPTNMCITGCHA